MSSGLFVNIVLFVMRFGVVIPIGNLALRPFPTRWAIGLMKRMHLDIRTAWEWERLYFLSRRTLPLWLRLRLLHAWSLVTWSGRGIAWGCAMEASYRVYNLAWFLYENAEKSQGRKDFALAHRLIQREILFISENLETHSFNNHYAFNVFAMLISSPILENTDESHWITELDRILVLQFNTDGTNFEASTSYHQLMLEAITRLIILRPDLSDRVHRVLNVCGATAFSSEVAPNGTLLWQIGDTDGSSVVRDGQSLADLLECAGLAHSYDRNSGTRVFPDFGASFHKSEDIRFALWAPRLGQAGRGGHNHADSLSLTCSIHERPVIGDPGVPLYALARRYFRSAFNHSGPFPAGEEPIMQTGSFRMTDAWKVDMVRRGHHEVIASCIKVPGYGYERRLTFVPSKGVKVVDCALGSAPMPCPKLVIDPKYRIEIIDLTRAMLIPRDRNGGTLLVEAIEGIAKLEVIGVWYSQSYFSLSRSSILRLCPNQNECRWKVTLQ